MEKNVLLALIGFGLLVMIVGCILWCLPTMFIKENLRFITPLPPIAVAVYVYVSRIADLHFKTSQAFLFEIAFMTMLVAIAYFIFTLLLFIFLKMF